VSTESTPSVPTSPISSEGAESASQYSPEVMAALNGQEPPAPEENKEAEKPNETEKPKVDFLAPKFAALTRKEKALKAQEQTLKARETEISSKLQALEAKLAEYETRSKQDEEKWKANPLKAAQERGTSLEELIKIQMNDENPTPEMLMARKTAEIESKMMAKLQEVEAKLAAKEQAEKDAQTKAAEEQYNKAVEGYKAEIGTYITQNADTYELIAANDATDLVFQVAEEFFQKTKRVPDIKEAADAVEAHFEEEAKKLFELKKFKQASKPTPPAKTQTAPTLSNTAAATVPHNGQKELTREESLREVSKLIRWDE
jgi:hypothetical protein